MHSQNKNIAKDIINLYDKLKSERISLEQTWNEVSHYMRPNRNDQIPSAINKDIYDSTAILAAENLVSGLWSLINNSSNNWFYLKAKGNYGDYDLNQWLRSVTKLMHETLLDAYCGFYHKSYSFYYDLICFGTAIFYVAEDLDNKKIVFKTLDLYNTLIDSTYGEDIDTVIRRIDLTAKQAINFFGAENLSHKIHSAVEQNMDTKFGFLHFTAPINYFNDYVASIKKMLYSSYYVSIDEPNIVKKGGYYEFPYKITRWYTNAQSQYGQSPAMAILPDVKMINSMAKTILIAAQKQVDPPLLAPNEAVIQGMKTGSTNPGGIIYGGIDPHSGNQLLKPLMVGENLSSSYELHNQRRQAIKDAFYNSLLVFSYSHNATATEVMSVNEQKLRILGSKVARIQTEFLAPVVTRLYHILKRMDLLPSLPQQVKDRDISIEVDFCGTWNRYQKMIDGVGVQQMTSAVNNIKQLYPDIIHNIDWQEVIRIIAQGYGVPEDIIFSSNNNDLEE